MEFFVDKESVVRKIWGKADIILFIFAGSSSEFALNKAVDWLYFTGNLPADPLGRLFSTVNYARQIVFSTNNQALQAIDKISVIHQSIEQQRGSKIPEWAYRDVLFMLIDYSIRAYEVLERKLSELEKEEVFEVFYRVGQRMQITGLPNNYLQWCKMRDEHLKKDLEKSRFTVDLYKQYKKHLGPVRYKLLLEGQILVVPQKVNDLLGLGRFSLLSPVLGIYKLLRFLHLDWVLKSAILPKKYHQEIRQLDIV